MPLFLAALWGALIQVLGTVVGRVLLSLGVGYATFSAVDTSIAFARSHFFSAVSGLPASAIGVMSVLNIGVAVSMLCSAVTMRLVYQGMVGGTIKRMFLK